MGRTIYKQPNGLYTIFSSVVDSPIYWNVTKEEYIQIKIDEARKEIEREAVDIFDKGRYVHDFGEMKERLIRETTEEEFKEFLHDVGYKGTIEDFCVYNVNWFPEDEKD